MGEQSGEASGSNAAGSLIPSNLVELERNIKAAESIWETLEGGGFRSVKGEIVNLTSKSLHMVEEAHHSGGWTNVQPEPFIGPRTTMLFGSRNRSLGEGTKGYLGYRSEDGVMFHCSWSNPAIGDGKIAFGVEGVNGPRYGVRALCSVGNTDSRRRWIIFPTQDVPEQDQWRACSSCNALFYGGFEHAKGRCSRPPSQQESVQIMRPEIDEPTPDWGGGGGQWLGPVILRPRPTPPPAPRPIFSHDADTSVNYVLHHDVPPLAHEEASWRFCAKCFSLFYGNFDRPGRCVGGGAHEPQGYDYLLTHDIDPPQLPAQHGWRVCSQCHVLFFDGWPERKGHCPARDGYGAHVADATVRYSLRHR